MSCLWRICVFSVVKHSHVFCVFLQRAGPTTTKPKASPSSHSYGHLHSKCKQRGHLTICLNTAVSSLLTLCQAATCPFVLEASLPELWDARTSRIKQRSMWMRGAFNADHLDTLWGYIKADATGCGGEEKSSFCLTCTAVPQRDPQKPEFCCAAVNGGGVGLRHAAFMLSVLWNHQRPTIAH